MPASFLEIDRVGRIFRGANDYVALQDVDFTVKEGEFVSIVGHSGCGKSTLLNIVAGLDRATTGGVVLEGREVRSPGPDRMVVFQNHSLLPWFTVRQNIALAVDRALKHLPKRQRQAIVEEHIDRVGLRPAADKYPREISGGMKQRVGIARALAIRPKVLLLDEPFGALDALTRGRLQEQLMHICNEHRITAIAITHDVDEALLLSDRVVMMTVGPAARIGRVLAVDLPRPRERMEVVNNPNYYRMRGEIVDFLNRQKQLKQERSKRAVTIAMRRGNLEKVNLTLGFVPLTDSAPFIVAQEKGLFAKHGLDVTLLRERSWSAIAEGIQDGRLDAAAMVTGMPLALTLGWGGQFPVPVATTLTLSRNGNAITIAKALWEQGVHTLADLKPYVQSCNRRPVLGAVHPVSMHNLLLRHWLASGGIDPDRDVEIDIVPPPQMVANLMAGNIIGYCSGEPWNSRAMHEDVGCAIATDLDIWAGHPEKVLGVRVDWLEQHPNTHLALVKALLEACQFCDEFANRDEVLAMLCLPAYLNADPVWVRPGLAGPYRKGGGTSAYLKDFNRFLGGNAPSRAEQTWVLAHAARWGLLPFPGNCAAVLDFIVRPDAYRQAAQELELPVELDEPSALVLADGTTFDPLDPLRSLAALPFGQKPYVREVALGPRPPLAV